MNPLTSKKEIDEFLERRSNLIQKQAKASTPSEKALMFEITNSSKKARWCIETAKFKNRVPILLSTKR